MEMTFKDYIQNPMGKRNAVFSQREMFRSIYSSKLDKLLLRENNKIVYELYKDKEDYWIHIKVPSETIEKFYYDVVIKFYTSTVSLIKSQSLKDYNVKFFSNDPHFVFTYAYVFSKNDLFIEELKPRMSKLALRDKPKETNASQTVGYVKSLYFAYLIMENRGLFVKAKFSAYAKRLNKKDLISKIEPADKKIAARQEAQTKLNKEKKKEKEPERDVQNKEYKYADTTKPSKGIANTKTIGVVKTVKKTATTKKK